MIGHPPRVDAETARSDVFLPAPEPEPRSDALRALKSAEPRVEGFWLVREATLPSQEPLETALLWRLLEANALLPAGARYLLASESVLRARVDAPLDPEEDSQPPLAAMCESLARAALFPMNRPVGVPAPETAFPEEEPAKSATLAEICAAAGWPFSEQADGSLRVVLEGRGRTVQARIVRARSGSVRVSVPLLAVPESSVSRRALAVFLLSIARVVRLARPVAVSTEGEPARAELEAVLEREPAAEELAHAFSALSVAVHLCAAEAASLADETVARRYLSVRGMDPRTA